MTSLISDKILALLNKNQLEWITELDEQEIVDILVNAYNNTLISEKECSEKEALSKYGTTASLINKLLTLIINRDLIIKYYPDKIMIYHEDVLQFWFCYKQDSVFEIDQVVYNNNSKLIEQMYLTPLNNVIEDDIIFQQIQQFINNYKLYVEQSDTEVKINSDVMVLGNITENQEIINLVPRYRQSHLKRLLEYFKKYPYHKTSPNTWRINCDDIVYFNLSFANNEYTVIPEINSLAVDYIKTAINAIIKRKLLIPRGTTHFSLYHSNIMQAVKRILRYL